VNAGLYDGIDEAVYHADKESLSVSGAKKLLPPSCPAIFHHEREHGQPHKAVFDFGKAAHAVVLGAGADIKVVDADSWRTKAAKEDADAIRAAGHTPILAHEWQQIRGMADAIKAHPLASALLNPERGKPEQSGYWTDDVTGVLRRFRLDWLPDTDGGRLLVADYKTCQAASRPAIAKAVASFRYFMQDAWYRDGLHALGLADDVAFLFIFQEKTAPYLVNVVELEPAAVELGRKRNDEALRIYRDCTEAGVWPGYSSEVELINLPRWAYYEDAV
jgi:hypothetical protein